MEDPVPRSDRELWSSAAAGDQQAFSELFERHVKAVWNYAYRLTGSWSRAEDLAANTFLIAWRKRGELVLVNSDARPWLFTVVGNLARTEARSALRAVRAFRRLPRQAEVSDHAEAVASDLATRQRLREVLAAIRQLPTAQRKAVELCLLGEVSTADAAAVLGITQVSVRAHISRARARPAHHSRGAVMTDEDFQLNLPPERELPPTVRDRLRGKVLTGMNPRGHARRYTPLAIAAGVTLLVAGGVLLTQHGATGPTVSSGATNANEARCIAAATKAGYPDLFGSTPDFSSAITASGFGRQVFGIHLPNNNAVFCETTETTVTISNPSQPQRVPASQPAITLLASDDGVLAGTVPVNAKNLTINVIKTAGFSNTGVATVENDMFIFIGEQPDAPHPGTVYAADAAYTDDGGAFPGDPTTYPKLTTPAPLLFTVDRPQQATQSSALTSCLANYGQGNNESFLDQSTLQSGATTPATVFAYNDTLILSCAGGVANSIAGLVFQPRTPLSNQRPVEMLNSQANLPDGTYEFEGLAAANVGEIAVTSDTGAVATATPDTNQTFTIQGTNEKGVLTDPFVYTITVKDKRGKTLYHGPITPLAGPNQP